jgi:N6-L-threonylcarbamoyladenine synthase
MYLLGIETSCDETAVALAQVTDGSVKILSSLVSSQMRLHQPFGGVVPELATREHLRNLPALAAQILADNNLCARSLDAIAVTQGPGLAPALLVGHSYAHGLGVALGKPVYGVNHLEGHLFSPFMNLSASTVAAGSDRRIPFPFIGLVVSGGHTLLVHTRDWNDYHKLGGTVDDAAGEAFDKVARLLNLPYPGGPQIEQRAKEGDPKAFDFPQSFPERDNFNFSFSGLKTAVRYTLEKNPALLQDASSVANVCASFQRAVVEVLVRKTVAACNKTQIKALSVSGGVVCNRTLRAALEQECAKNKIALHVADPALCTDNAAMVAAIAAFKLCSGPAPTQKFEINPNLPISY